MDRPDATGGPTTAVPERSMGDQGSAGGAGFAFFWLSPRQASCLRITRSLQALPAIRFLSGPALRWRACWQLLGWTFARLCEEFDHLGIAHLVEIDIVHPDRKERFCHR